METVNKGLLGHISLETEGDEDDSGGRHPRTDAGAIAMLQGCCVCVRGLEVGQPGLLLESTHDAMSSIPSVAPANCYVGV